MMRGFTDIHAHFVYGVDDGPRTPEDMYRMLDAANADGITCLFATPHATPGIYPFPQDKLAQGLAEARAYCKQMEYEISLFEGAEILYTPAMERFAQERKLPTLADSNIILIEFVPDITMAEMKQALSLVQDTGYKAILAHIERYSCMFGLGAYRIKEKFDVDYQLNCASIIKRCGFFKDLCIDKWLKDGLIDFVATDSHDPVRRPTCMQRTYSELERRCGFECAGKLTGLDA